LVILDINVLGGNKMGFYIFNFTFIFQVSVFIILLYYLILSFFGLYKKEEKPSHKPLKTFAVVVAAHNEETVIGKIIDSINRLDYPHSLYDIFVVADNCTDMTANISRQHGANVFERSDEKNRGKGYALEWIFDKIFKMKSKYDAIAVFDADNLVSKNFLTEMNSKMLEGYKVIQGYIDSKNPHDSWITESYSISFWSASRLFQLARSNLKLSNQIGGTGFVVETDLLRKIGWGATCLTEDLEFTCKLVLNGYKIGWAHKAIVYDEKPLTLKQSWNQRKRWMQGFTDVASRFFFKLIRKAFRERDFVSLDCALYVIQPFVTLLLGVSFLLTLAQNNYIHGLNIFTIDYLFSERYLLTKGYSAKGYLFAIFIWRLFSIFQFLLTPLALTLENKLSKRLFALLSLYSFNVFALNLIFDNNDKLLVILLGHCLYLIICFGLVYLILGKQSSKIFIWYLLYAIYTLTWIPITIQGILNKNNKDWSHTKHIRQIGIGEI
jgi:cellulose synthase/poly-beta-1,6-N-acetylglucosamine synthase-like glycosyltransferase